MNPFPVPRKDAYHDALNSAPPPRPPTLPENARGRSLDEFCELSMMLLIFVLVISTKLGTSFFGSLSLMPRS